MLGHSFDYEILLARCCLSRQITHALPDLEKEETNLNCNDYDELIQLGSNYDFRFLEIKEITRINLKTSRYAWDYFKEAPTKLRAWEVEGYDIVGLLDADMCVIRNMDELLELDLDDNKIAACLIYPESTSMAPITNSESDFNAGLIILQDIEKMRAMNLDERGDFWILYNWWWRVYRDECWEEDDFK
ncbi:19612_t:CDS:2, partial [Racocetra fulgida]